MMNFSVIRFKERNRCHGQALVEFAFVAVALIALTLGVLEIGRMVLCYTTIANAARIGTRYAIVHGSDNAASITQIQTVVEGFLKAGTVDDTSNTTITVSYPPLPPRASGCTDPGCLVNVTVSYLYDPLMGYFPLGNIHLSSTSQGVITW